MLTYGKVADCIDKYLLTEEISHITKSVGNLHESYIVFFSETGSAIEEGLSRCGLPKKYMIYRLQKRIMKQFDMCLKEFKTHKLVKLTSSGVNFRKFCNEQGLEKI